MLRFSSTYLLRVSSGKNENSPSSEMNKLRTPEKKPLECKGVIEHFSVYCSSRSKIQIGLLQRYVLVCASMGDLPAHGALLRSAATAPRCFYFHPVFPPGSRAPAVCMVGPAMTSLPRMRSGAPARNFEGTTQVCHPFRAHVPVM